MQGKFKFSLPQWFTWLLWWCLHSLCSSVPSNITFTKWCWSLGIVKPFSSGPIVDECQLLPTISLCHDMLPQRQIQTNGPLYYRKEPPKLWATNKLYMFISYIFHVLCYWDGARLAYSCWHILLYLVLCYYFSHILFAGTKYSALSISRWSFCCCCWLCFRNFLLYK